MTTRVVIPTNSTSTSTPPIKKVIDGHAGRPTGASDEVSGVHAIEKVFLDFLVGTKRLQLGSL
jgi:hypothetical protein